MDRRNFIKSSVGLTLLATGAKLGAVQSDKSALPDYPDWLDKEIAATRQRIDAYKKGKNCAVFMCITDLHSGLHPNQRKSDVHIRYLNKAAEDIGADAVLNLGDWGLESPIKREEDGMGFFQNIIKYHSETKLPTLFCVGNHDHYYKIFSSEFLGMYYRKFSKNAVFGKDGHYGYQDFSDKKCRVFFLNTSDEVYYGFSDAQMDFFEKNLNAMPKDWAAVVFTHYCVDVKGAWAPFNEPKGKNIVRYKKIMSDFVGKGGKLAANVTGDSHFDRTFNTDGVNYFISQGYGGVPDRKKPKDVVFKYFNYKKTMLAEAVVVNADDREIRLFRLGYGGAEKDRGAKF